MAVRRIGDGSGWTDKNIIFDIPGIDKTNYFVSCWIKCHSHSTANNSINGIWLNYLDSAAIQYGYFRYNTDLTGNDLIAGHDDFPPSGGEFEPVTAVKNQGWQWFVWSRYSADVEDPPVVPFRSIRKNDVGLGGQGSPETASGTVVDFQFPGRFDADCEYSFFDLRVYSRVFLAETNKRSMMYAAQGKDGIITDDITSSGKTCNLLLRTCIANKATNGTDTGNLGQCNDYGPLKLTPDMSAVDANFQSEPDPWSPWTIGG